MRHIFSMFILSMSLPWALAAYAADEGILYRGVNGSTYSSNNGQENQSPSPLAINVVVADDSESDSESSDSDNDDHILLENIGPSLEVQIAEQRAAELEQQAREEQQRYAAEAAQIQQMYGDRDPSHLRPICHEMAIANLFRAMIFAADTQNQILPGLRSQELIRRFSVIGRVDHPRAGLDLLIRTFTSPSGVVISAILNSIYDYMIPLESLQMDLLRRRDLPNVIVPLHSTTARSVRASVWFNKAP